MTFPIESILDLGAFAVMIVFFFWILVKQIPAERERSREVLDALMKSHQENLDRIFEMAAQQHRELIAIEEEQNRIMREFWDRLTTWDGTERRRQPKVPQRPQ